jgi:RNA polymerase sigma-70 factor (ECF subfamily)
MNAQHDQVSDAWRAHRTYLVDLAFRMLGDMAVQDLCPNGIYMPVMTSDDVRFVVPTSAAAYCPEYVQ